MGRKGSKWTNFSLFCFFWGGQVQRRLLAESDAKEEALGRVRELQAKIAEVRNQEEGGREGRRKGRKSGDCLFRHYHHSSSYQACLTLQISTHERRLPPHLLFTERTIWAPRKPNGPSKTGSCIWKASCSWPRRR